MSNYEFFDEDEQIRMLDDEYRFRAFLREYGLDDRKARHSFKKDLKDK